MKETRVSGKRMMLKYELNVLQNPILLRLVRLYSHYLYSILFSAFARNTRIIIKAFNFGIYIYIYMAGVHRELFLCIFSRTL